ncbi:MAG: putative toxin-antitoxin system toxin component, PIN family [Gemmatimonadales bacterium]
MKVFLDTNVLVSAFATRALCEDVFRYGLTEHELLVGEVVLMELRRTLGEKLGFPKRIVSEIEQLLGERTLVPEPSNLPQIPLRDRDDLRVLASAIAGRAEVLVTGDRDLLSIAGQSPIPILDPRGFWAMMREQAPPGSRR